MERLIAGFHRCRRRHVARADEIPLDQRQRACELEALRDSLRNTHTFPWLADRVADGSLQVDALYLDLERGQLLLYDRAKDTFDAA